jgi:hypothetical protein
VIAADVNSDGKPDLVVANYCVSGGFCKPGSVGVLINTSIGGTTTALVSSPDPSSFQQSVTVTATVTSQGFKAKPIGTVTFNDGATTLGTASLTNGIAILSTSSLAVGTHSINASYSGDNNFSGSTSAPLMEIVNPAMTTTTLVSSADPVGPNQPVTYEATVTS